MYLKIKNDGLLDPKGLFLLGASSKRDDDTKIGRFGSGNKYALAYLLRNNYELQIFSGEEKIEIETRKEDFRGQEFHVIHINGEKSSITTEMGVDWVLWQAIREIYCNSIDEGGAEVKRVPFISPEKDETHFYIKVNDEIKEFLKNFDNYFTFRREPLYKSPRGSIFAKCGESANVYRRGVRCHESILGSIFDYDLPDLPINEDRMVRYSISVDNALWNLVFGCTDKNIIRRVLHECCDGRKIENDIYENANFNNPIFSTEFREVAIEGNFAPISALLMLRGDEIKDYTFLPTPVFKFISSKIEGFGERFNKKGSAEYILIEPNATQQNIIDNALLFLIDAGINVPYSIRLAQMKDKRVLGAAKESTNEIILSDISLTKGLKDVINTIIEEYIHLKYGVMDETRAFQTAVINEFIGYMELKQAVTL